MFHSPVRFFLILVFILSLLYSNTLQAPFCFDDGPNILKNPSIRMEGLGLAQMEKTLRENFLSVRQGPFLTFAVNHFLGAYHPFGYHIFNIIIHALNACLVFCFAFLTLSLPSLKTSRNGAFFIAGCTSLLWAFHPIQTNVTVYIVQRMASLAALFYLLSFLAYIHGRRLLGRSTMGSFSWFTLAIFCWILSLVCKQNTVLLPFLILVYDCFFSREKIPGKDFFGFYPLLLSYSLYCF